MDDVCLQQEFQNGVNEAAELGYLVYLQKFGCLLNVPP